MAPSLFVLLACIFFASTVAGHKSPVAWLKHAETVKDDSESLRRTLSQEKIAIDEEFLRNTEISLDDGTGVVQSSKGSSCYGSLIFSGVRVFCDGKLHSSMVSKYPGSKEIEFMQRISEDELVKYDATSILVQKHIEGKKTCSHDHTHDHDHDHPNMPHDDIVSEFQSPEGWNSQNQQPLESSLKRRDLQAVVPGNQNALKFLDVLIVVDAATYRQWGGTRAIVEARVVSIAAMAKQIFLNLNAIPFGFNIRLAGIYLFTSTDPFSASKTQSTELLADFNTWKLKATGLASHSLAHMFSANNLDDLVASYGRPVVCQSASSSSLSYSKSSSDGFLAKLLAHAIGHSLGMQHTSQFSPGWGVTYDMAIKCIYEENDVMRASLPIDSAVYSWSVCATPWVHTFLAGSPFGCGVSASCSVAQIYGMRSDYPACMESSAGKIREALSTCGDGVLDAGEQCDCGPQTPAETCALTQCCIKQTCQRIAGCTATGGPTGSPTRLRPTPKPTGHPTLPVSFNCYNLCFTAYDGECQDGGPGSVAAFCPYGSDCVDCGVRAPYTREPSISTSSAIPSVSPSASTSAPTPRPQNTKSPTRPTKLPTLQPTQQPTTNPSSGPTFMPTKKPTTESPTKKQKTSAPSSSPTIEPTSGTKAPTTNKPTAEPPTRSPSTTRPSSVPSSSPSKSAPTPSPSASSPSSAPTQPRPTASPTNKPTNLVCPTDAQLQNCKVGPAVCATRRDCLSCVVNKAGDRKCVAALPSAVTGLIQSCSNDHIQYIKTCIDQVGASSVPTSSPYVESKSPTLPSSQPASTQAPSSSPSVSIQCPSASILARCKTGPSVCANRLNDCVICSGRCIARMKGVLTCSAEHQASVKNCANGDNDTDSPTVAISTASPTPRTSDLTTSTPTVSPTPKTVITDSPSGSVSLNDSALVCPPDTQMQQCRVGQSNCKGPCTFCNSRCIPILSYANGTRASNLCGDVHQTAARDCMQTMKD